MRKYFIVLFLSLLPSFSMAETQFTAVQLNEKCNEINKGIKGEKFDEEATQICEGYLYGFFDSILIIEQVAKMKSFCLPESLPKNHAGTLLSEWITQNPKIAEKTTASVALFAAFKKAFPCKEKK